MGKGATGARLSEWLRWLPRGRQLPAQQWEVRHRIMRVLVLLHAAGLAVFALARQEHLDHAIVEAALVALPALVASLPRLPRSVRSSVASLGLVAASGVLVHLSGGVIEAHFHFFVIVALLTLYQQWAPFLVAIGFVVLHHGTVGVLDSGAVYNHYAAVNNPWKWAAIHGLFVLAASTANLVSWRVSEDARLDVERWYRQLKESDERFRAYFDSAAVGLSLVKADGTYAAVNAAFGTITGRSVDDLLGREVVEITHEDDRRDSLAAVRRLTSGVINAVDIEKRYVRPDGGIAHVVDSVSAIRDDNGNAAYITVVTQDITERKVAEQALKHQALHDDLTDLPNRALFLDRLGHALARASRSTAQTAVLYLDIDRFKWVNDSFGHGVADELLVTVAQRLQTVVRPGDTVARFVGDEFVVLCEDLPVEGEANAVAQRLAAAITQPFQLVGREVRLSASVGVAVADGNLARQAHATTPRRAAAAASAAAEELVHRADAAKSRAKELGRDRIELFDEGIRARTAARLETEGALRTGIDHDELEVHYQPVMDLGSGAVAGVEALVRWRRRDGTLVPPGDFIPLAEETGLIVPLGTYVLRTAAATVARWNRERGDRPLALSVNISARQLESPGLVELVIDVLAETGIEPQFLHLELTESVLAADEGLTLIGLEALKELGVRLNVDDFGTGYSSLLYLRKFPVDVLKIDRSFVSGLGASSADTAIVRGVVDLGQALGLVTVAEGVETPEQLAALRDLGCDLAQGYHWCRPLPADQFVEWINSVEGVDAGEQLVPVVASSSVL